MSISAAIRLLAAGTPGGFFPRPYVAGYSDRDSRRSGSIGIRIGLVPTALRRVPVFVLILGVLITSACSMAGNGVTSVPPELVLDSIEGNFASMESYDASGEMTVTKDRKVYDLSVRLRAVFPSTARLDVLYGGSMGVMGGKTMSLVIENGDYLGYVPDENTFFRGTVDSGELEEFALDAEVFLLLLMGMTSTLADYSKFAVKDDDKYVITGENELGKRIVIEVDSDIFLPIRIEVLSPEGNVVTAAEAGGFIRHGPSWIATEFQLAKSPGSDKLSFELEPKSYDMDLAPADLEIEIPEGAIQGELEL
jgi:hypothetical protein